MPSTLSTTLLCLVVLVCAETAQAARVKKNCHSVNPQGDQSLLHVSLPPTNRCSVRINDGYPVPDPFCTPGGINPTVTADILRDPAFSTTICTRNNATTATQKNGTYKWYSIPHPSNNKGASQTCELDHFVPLELGGADTLDNIWPQCGPPGVALPMRYFKQKDMVENYLAAQVKARSIDLSDAQYGIARDWTRYLHAAKQYYAQLHVASHRTTKKKVSKRKSTKSRFK